MKQVKVAVLGYGHLGKWHCQKADGIETAQLVAIVEKFPAAQKAARENHPNAKIVDDISEIMDEIDAAVIVTPTSTHYELTKILLLAGKHVFCEKPLCSSYEEAQQLAPLLKKGQVLQVGHSERCHEAWEILSDDFKKIRSPFQATINRVAAFKGRATDVDVVQDLMIHDIDLMLHLLARRPVSLKAWGSKIRTDNWDHVTCEFEFNSGTVVTMTSGRNHVKEIRSFELMSKEGCLFVDLFTNEILKATNTTFVDGSFVQTNSYTKRDHLLIEQAAFYNSILNDEKIMVDYQDGLKAVYLIDQVRKSLETSERIQLSVD